MLKKTITYTDYNGIERTEDFYFNLTKSEILEMELGTTGGLEQQIKKIVAAQDSKQIIEVFKDIILRAYGEKSADGRRFVKIDEYGHRLSNEFMQTEAYNKLFMELAFDDKAAAEFVNGIIPKMDKKDVTKQLEDK